MKVQDLIAELLDYDPDLNIKVATAGTTWYYDEEAGYSVENDIVVLSADFRVEREADYIVLR